MDTEEEGNDWKRMVPYYFNQFGIPVTVTHLPKFWCPFFGWSGSVVTVDSERIRQNTFLPWMQSHPRPTRDMAEVFACICGVRAQEQERIINDCLTLWI